MADLSFGWICCRKCVCGDPREEIPAIFVNHGMFFGSGEFENDLVACTPVSNWRDHKNQLVTEQSVDTVFAYARDVCGLIRSPTLNAGSSQKRISTPGFVHTAHYAKSELIL